MRSIEDNKIIKSIIKGNVSDFNILIDRYKSRAFSLAFKLLKNEMDAEDALQDSFVKTFYSLSSFRNEAKFSTYFYRIVYNTCINKIAKNKKLMEDSIEEYENLLGQTEDYSVNLNKNSTFNDFLVTAINMLPPKYSSVIALFYQDGFSCEEISSILNTSVSNVKVLLHRARTLLKKVIEENGFVKELL